MNVMRKIVILLMIIIFLFSLSNCYEELTNTQNLRLCCRNKGGCFIEKNTLKSLFYKNDTVSFVIVNDTLKMNVEIKSYCNADLKDSIVINNNSISIFVKNISNNNAKCLCYYIYNYKFIHYTPKTLLYDIKLKEFSEKEYTTIFKDTIK